MTLLLAMLEVDHWGRNFGGQGLEVGGDLCINVSSQVLPRQW